MTEETQAAPQATSQMQQIAIGNVSGGAYPDPDGTWRVCIWLSGLRTEQDAQSVGGWLQGILGAHIQRPPAAAVNGQTPPGDQVKY